MVNEFKLTMHHRSFCTPKPDADQCMRVDLKTKQKTVENQDYYWAAGRWAFGPSQAVGRGPLGLRAAGPPGHLGPRAVGRWAAGLLLAKPDLRRLERVFHCSSVCETMEDYKKGYLIVWANYVSPCNSISISGLYFEGTCGVISVTMATLKVHKNVH